MNRLNDVYETRQPRPASSSWMRVTCRPVGGQPLVDLVRPGGEDLLGRYLHLPRARNTQPRQAGQLLLARSRTVTGQARLHRRIDVPANCRARQPRTRCYLPLAHARLPAAYHFCYLHSRHLPVRHCCSLHPICSNGRHSGAQGGQSPGEVVYSSWRSPLLLVHSSWRLTGRAIHSRKPEKRSKRPSASSCVLHDPDIRRTYQTDRSQARTIYCRSRYTSGTRYALRS